LLVGDALGVGGTCSTSGSRRRVRSTLFAGARGRFTRDRAVRTRTAMARSCACCRA